MTWKEQACNGNGNGYCATYLTAAYFFQPKEKIQSQIYMYPTGRYVALVLVNDLPKFK